MSANVHLIGLFLSMIVIVVSLLFIRHQLKLNQAREEKIRAGEARYDEERQKRVDSVRVLLTVAGSAELNWIEASIRIKHLLDQLGVDLSAHDDISVFYIITEKTAHIPTHEQWKTLPKMAKDKFSKEMQSYEKEYAEHLSRGKSSLTSYKL